MTKTLGKEIKAKKLGTIIETFFKQKILYFQEKHVTKNLLQ